MADPNFPEGAPPDSPSDGAGAKPQERNQILPDPQPQRAVVKRFETARAVLGLLGATVHELKAGGYMVSCGGLSRIFRSLDDLLGFAENPGGRK
jgi:hypothetical protein